MSNIIKTTSQMLQSILRATIGANTGVIGLTIKLKNHIIQNPATTLAHFTANIPLWLIWGIFLTQNVIQFTSRLNIGVTFQPTAILVFTLIILISRGYIISLTHKKETPSSGLKSLLFGVKNTIAYTAKYTREKFIGAGLYLILIITLPLIITGSTVVFAIAVSAVIILWSLRRSSRVDIFYKGVVAELALVIMWLEFITATGLLHQGIVFLMIIITVGVFSTLRVNKVQRNIARQG